MYRFSRAIYRELAGEIVVAEGPCGGVGSHERVLRACEAAIERLATDRHYFAKPARTLFTDIRTYFPMCSQHRVWNVVERYMAFADEYFQRQPMHGFDINGNPLECRATTRKGTPCQRMPLPHNGYCPSHQHLAETEQVEVVAPLAAEGKRELQLAA
jgi:hypothetical protein